MRQRKIKNLEEKLDSYQELLVRDPIGQKGKWSELFAESRPLYLEIGCGRGGFITGMAKLRPERNYLGVEGLRSVALRALQNVSSQGCPNIRIAAQYINDPGEWFSDNEISGLYLNFSDPWPKDRHSKRRLTSAGYMDQYKRILKPGSSIEIKTDNENLFVFSLESIKSAGFEILEMTEDLHSSDISARLVMTEYEAKFAQEGRKIRYLKAITVL